MSGAVYEYEVRPAGPFRWWVSITKGPTARGWQVFGSRDRAVQRAERFIAKRQRKEWDRERLTVTGRVPPTSKTGPRWAGTCPGCSTPVAVYADGRMVQTVFGAKT